MIAPFYAYLGALILLMTVGRIVWRRTPPKVDWELIVAFVRLEFPPEQRDVAQKIAAGLAEIVGLKIRQLKPEDTVKQIANWAEERINTWDLIKIFNLAYGVNCEPDTTFRSLVESIVDERQRVKPVQST
jgi:hypothetical protein